LNPGPRIDRPQLLRA